jgi:predicted small lipoprotein YifL
MTFRSVRGAIALVLVASFALAGCGRRGDLEPPPGQPLTTTQEGKKVDPGIVKPDRPFVLDGLLN